MNVALRQLSFLSLASPVVDRRGGEDPNGLVASVAMAAGFRMLGILPKLPFRLTSGRVT